MRSPAEVIARFDEFGERQCPSKTAESAALVERIAAAARAENRAAAEQLAVIGELFGYRLSRCSETEDWAIDTMEAVAAEVAAELRISQGLAASRLRYARAMRERLPRLGAVFAAGDIDDVLAAVDGELAVKVVRWPSMTQGRLAAQVDTIVARADVDAVRRRRKRQTDREIWIWESCDGVAEIRADCAARKRPARRPGSDSRDRRPGEH
jgi:hypothetical protein